jgi:hypothetical protein
VHPDPGVNGLPILWRNGPKRHEDLRLRQDIFVQDGGPLGDQRHPEASGPATPDEVFDGAQQALLPFHWPLGCERIGLVKHQMEGLPVFVVEPLGEVGHQAGLLALPAVGEVEDHRETFFHHQIRDALTGTFM